MEIRNRGSHLTLVNYSTKLYCRFFDRIIGERTFFIYNNKGVEVVYP
jgi:hypothetical protein